MAYITPILSNNPPTKGTSSSIGLNKSSLQSDAGFQSVADTYFTDSTNWRSVEIVMKSTEGSQTETMIFDCDNLDNLVYADFLISEKSRDTWEVQTVAIFDFDGGHLILSAAKGQVNGLDFNFDLSAPPVVANYYENNFDPGTSPTLYEIVNDVTYGSFGSLELQNLQYGSPIFQVVVENSDPFNSNTYVEQEGASSLIVPSFNNLVVSLDVVYIADLNGPIIITIEVEDVYFQNYQITLPDISAIGTYSTVITQSTLQSYGINTIGSVNYNFTVSLALPTTAVSIDNLIFTTN